jgi:hypothetical protein
VAAIMAQEKTVAHISFHFEILFSSALVSWGETFAAPIHGSKLGTVDTAETGDGGRFSGWASLMIPAKPLRSNGALQTRLFVIVTASINARNALEFVGRVLYGQLHLESKE